MYVSIVLRMNPSYQLFIKNEIFMVKALIIRPGVLMKAAVAH